MSISRALVLASALIVGAVSGNSSFAADQKAIDQAKKANEGQKESDQVFDGRKAPAPAVKAGPSKPTTAEQRVKEYKESGPANPGKPPKPSKEPPPPEVKK